MLIGGGGSNWAMNFDLIGVDEIKSTTLYASSLLSKYQIRKTLGTARDGVEIFRLHQRSKGEEQGNFYFCDG